MKRFELFFEDAKLLEEIGKDVVGTHPDLYFFLEAEKYLGARRYAAIVRILFAQAKLNKGVSGKLFCTFIHLVIYAVYSYKISKIHYLQIRYVQGRSEIVGTIYYVLANDHNGQWAKAAEADTYYLFNALMMEIRDVFVPDLDHAASRIQGRISHMQNLLSKHDPEIQEHWQECGIDTTLPFMPYDGSPHLYPENSYFPIPYDYGIQCLRRRTRGAFYDMFVELWYSWYEKMYSRVTFHLACGCCNDIHPYMSISYSNRQDLCGVMNPKSPWHVIKGNRLA